MRRRLRQDVQDKQDGFAIQNPSLKGAPLMRKPIFLVYPVYPVRFQGFDGIVKDLCVHHPQLVLSQARSKQIKPAKTIFQDYICVTLVKKSPAQRWPPSHSKLCTQHLVLAGPSPSRPVHPCSLGRHRKSHQTTIAEEGPGGERCAASRLPVPPAQSNSLKAVPTTSNLIKPFSWVYARVRERRHVCTGSC